MAFTPVNGLEIYGNFVTSGTYTPVNGLEINGDFSRDANIYVRALIAYSGGLRQIEDNETGCGLLHVTDGNGAALVYNGSGGFRTVAASETLLF